MEGNLLPTVLDFQEPRAICIARSVFQQDNRHLEGLRRRSLRLPSKPQLEGRGKRSLRVWYANALVVQTRSMRQFLRKPWKQCLGIKKRINHIIWPSRIGHMETFLYVVCLVSRFRTAVIKNRWKVFGRDLRRLQTLGYIGTVCAVGRHYRAL